MNLVFVEKVKNELVAANLLIKESLHPWGEDTLPYFEGLESDIHWRMIPAVTALVYRSLGFSFRSTVYMTAIFRMVHFANHIHGTVRDDEEGQQYDRGFQFAILIGDYISGMILRLLSEIDSHYLIPAFTAMTCEINEGRVMRKLNAGRELDVETISRETASIYKTIFLTAAMAARLSDRERELYREIGHNLGMAVAIQYETCSPRAAYPYLDKAKSLQLAAGRERRRESENMVDNLIDELLGGAVIRKAAVV